MIDHLDQVSYLWFLHFQQQVTNNMINNMRKTSINMRIIQTKSKLFDCFYYLGITCFKKIFLFLKKIIQFNI
ncbi:hypothetical protein pb186bvf_011452 [Paramecium bursaria]